MSEVKDELETIVGWENVFTEPATLEKYFHDQSFAPPRKPNYVMEPQVPRPWLPKHLHALF